MNFIDYIWKDLNDGAVKLKAYMEKQKQEKEANLVRRNAELDHALKLKRLEDSIARKERLLRPKEDKRQHFASPRELFGGFNDSPGMFSVTRSRRKRRL